MTEQITIETSDGVAIVGDLYRPSGTPKGAILFLHMMPADRSSWQPLAERLNEAGYLGFAIDLRGHGASTHQGTTTLDYQRFSDTQHQQSRLDVDAALTRLRAESQLVDPQIGIVGASIGANLGLDALARNPALGWGVLLSPGLTYHGIETEPAISALAPPTRLLLVAGTNDTYSLTTVRAVVGQAAIPVTSREIENGGHGTELWTQDDTVLDAIVTWITTDK